MAQKKLLTMTQKTLNNTRSDLFLNFLAFLITFVIQLFSMFFFNGLDISKMSRYLKLLC